MWQILSYLYKNVLILIDCNYKDIAVSDAHYPLSGSFKEAITIIVVDMMIKSMQGKKYYTVTESLSALSLNDRALSTQKLSTRTRTLTR